MVCVAVGADASMVCVQMGVFARLGLLRLLRLLSLLSLLVFMVQVLDRALDIVHRVLHLVEEEGHGSDGEGEVVSGVVLAALRDGDPCSHTKTLSCKQVYDREAHNHLTWTGLIACRCQTGLCRTKRGVKLQLQEGVDCSVIPPRSERAPVIALLPLTSDMCNKGSD